ncbi:hypothetical protein IAU60_005017 [Kwoniella sp. DSM 27419]
MVSAQTSTASITSPIGKTKSPRSPRSPRSKADTFAPLSSILVDPTGTADTTSPPPLHQAGSPRAHLLRRVLSGGSTGSAAAGASTATPTERGSAPLSPASGSGGTRTPKAVRAPLKMDSVESAAGDQGMDVDMPVEVSGNGTTKRRRSSGKGAAGTNGAGPIVPGHQLASDLDQLKVQSPVTGNGVSGSVLGLHQPTDAQSISITPIPPPPQSQPPTVPPSSNFGPATSRAHTTHDRSYSTSTEGSTTSSSIHPIPPQGLGSSYGPEGFPVFTRSPEDSPVAFGSSQNNGSGYFNNMDNRLLPLAGFGGANSNGSGLDPELAARQAEVLAKADEAVRALNGTASLYQGTYTPGGSIPGMSTDEASVNPFAISRNYANFVTPQVNPSVTRQSSTSSSTTDAASTSSEESDWCIPTIEWVPTNPQSPGFPGSPYFNSPGSVFAQRERDRAASKMPPPALTGKPVSTPRRLSGNNVNTNGQSHGADAAPALSHQQSLPIGATAHTPSGLRASALPVGARPEAIDDDDDEMTVGHGRERSPSTSSQSAQSGLDLLWRAAQGIPKNPAPYDATFEHKGKRKAGAEAVDKWRSSGIPTGVSAPPATATVVDSEDVRAGSGAGEPPKKRRRSEMQLEEKNKFDRELSLKREAVGDSDVPPEDDSEYHSASASSETGGSGEDSEYNGGPPRHRGRPAQRGRRKGSPTAGQNRRSTSRTGSNALPGNVARPGKVGQNAYVNPASAPGGVTKGGTIKKVRKVGESPSGVSKGGRKGGAGGTPVPVLPNGVQCDYVNPLPPYNRCTDVFTRKYDLPRHMARHARREGELVNEGTLSEEKAILWRSIKDKPKVTCEHCGESFTRMDALKRHTAKQHHG